MNENTATHLMLTDFEPSYVVTFFRWCELMVEGNRRIQFPGLHTLVVKWFPLHSTFNGSLHIIRREKHNQTNSSIRFLFLFQQLGSVHGSIGSHVFLLINYNSIYRTLTTEVFWCKLMKFSFYKYKLTLN